MSELNGKFKIKTWNEMKEEFGESYDVIDIDNDKESFIDSMEEQMPESRVINVVDGYWKPETNIDGWHITNGMIKEKISE